MVGTEPAIAFVASLGAGLSTAVGAALVFVPRIYNPIYLALFLALAAGVMIFLSLVEIFQKSIGSYGEIPSGEVHSEGEDAHSDEEGHSEEEHDDHGHDDHDDHGHGHAEPLYDGPAAFALGCVTFFSGILLTAILDRIVHLLYHQAGVEGVHAHMLPNEIVVAEPETRPKATTAAGLGLIGRLRSQTGSARGSAITETLPKSEVQAPGVTAAQPADADSITLNDEENGRRRNPDTHNASPTTSVHDTPPSSRDAPDPVRSKVNIPTASLPAAILTAIAITLHNLPEGLATFIAFLSSPASGAPLAIAIAIHNIPEGICIAVPIWLATGKKWKGFLAGTVSGLAEPIGALIGWGIVGFQDASGAGTVSPTIFAVLFGIVGGMMIYVSFKELIPMALRCDKKDKVTTWGVFAGMAILALSLALFQLGAGDLHNH